MTVQSLIELLKTCNPEAEVIVGGEPATCIGSGEETVEIMNYDVYDGQ